MTANYEIDFATKTIIFTNKSFVQRANKEGSKEQMEVMGLRADFPTFKFEKKFTKGISNQNKGLSYEDMKKFIKANKTEEEADALLSEMETERAKHSLDMNPYKAMLTWFFKQFPEVKAQREADAAAAKEARSAR